MKIGYLGPEGSYSSLACSMFKLQAEKIEYNNFHAIFEAVNQMQIDCAVVPVENSLQGSVTQCLDLFLKYKNLYITKSKIIKIEHRLIMLESAELCDIKEIYSHEQALKQCNEFLSKQFPNAVIRATDSTAAAISKIKTKNAAGIVGNHIKIPGLKFLNKTISNQKNNQTVFMLIKKEQENVPKISKRIYLAVGSENKPGSLLKILEIFYNAKINILKIESRPHEINGEYIFFMELDANIAELRIQKILTLLQKKTTIYRFIGAY